MARQFAGGVTTDRITTALTTNANQRTYSIWSYRIGEGGGNLGRMFNKGTTTSVENFNNDIAGFYTYSRNWTTNGQWSIARPSANVWHHLLITYDSSLTTNVPAMYVDGVAQPVTPDLTPTGTRTDSAEAFNLGNRNDNARAWDGWLAEFAVWDRILSAGEIAGMAGGNPAWRYPISLASYITLKSNVINDFVLSAPTVAGTTEAPDPPLRHALTFAHIRPSQFTPGLAR